MVCSRAEVRLAQSPNLTTAGRPPALSMHGSFSEPVANFSWNYQRPSTVTTGLTDRGAPGPHVNAQLLSQSNQELVPPVRCRYRALKAGLPGPAPRHRCLELIPV